MNYLLHIFTLIMIFSIVAMSLNLLISKTQLLSLAHGGVFGIGAYAYAIATAVFNLNPVYGLIAAVICAASIGMVLTAITLKLSGDYAVLASLSLQIALHSLFQNLYSENATVGTWGNMTNGPFGIAGIPKFGNFLGLGVGTTSLIVTSCCFVCTVLLFRTIDRSAWALTAGCIRDDHLAASSLGKRKSLFRAEAILVSCTIAGLGGGLFAGHIGFIDPSSATIEESILLLSMVLIGGAGTYQGPILGAAMLIGFPELFKALGLPDSIAANFRVALYGVLLLAICHVRPNGIVGKVDL
jgi:branched-chain amino acid transport system permease protein